MAAGEVETIDCKLYAGENDFSNFRKPMNKHIIMSAEHLRKKIEDLNAEEERLAQEKKNINSKLIRILRAEYKTVWKIFAVPTNRNHCEHYVNGCFDSKEKAIAACGARSSHDSDDNCGWRYTIRELSINHKKVYDSDLLIINYQPEDFPHTGW